MNYLKSNYYVLMFFPHQIKLTSQQPENMYLVHDIRKS